MTVDTYHAEPDVTFGATLIDRLAVALMKEEIIYSHWKSNINLTKTSTLEVDLDLFVDRTSMPQALIILSQLGFKAAVARWGADSPGISHHYGLDEDSGQLIHVHLFSRMLTGESYVKSHLFPFEAMVLENVYYSGALRVTSKQAELVLFTLRAFIKYGSLFDLLSLRRRSESLREEVRWLQDGGNLGEALSLLRQHCPVIEEALFLTCIETLDSDKALIKRIILARQVRRRLKIYTRHSLLGRQLAYGQLCLAELRRRLGKKRKNKALQSGGAVIAIVGAEATGKSTLVAETGCWLAKTFAVRTLHAGKPPATLLTSPVRMLLPLLRRELPAFRTNNLEGHITSSHSPPRHQKEKGMASLVFAMRAVILAWERRQLLIHAGRAAANGELVICDRYPSDTVGVMDSPRLRHLLGQRGVVPDLYNRLANFEQRLYRQIPPPDVALRLNVNIETAQRRNRERIKADKETDAYIASRHRQSPEWEKLGTKHVYDIDTDQSLAETIRCVKKAIWDSL